MPSDSARDVYQELSNDYDDDDTEVEKDIVGMVRDLHWYWKAYGLMQKGQSPKPVLDEIAEASTKRGKIASDYVEIKADWTDKEKALCLNRLLTLWYELYDDGEEDDLRIQRALRLSQGEPKNFIDSLVVKVTNPSWLHDRKFQWKQWLRVKVEHEKLLPDLDLTNPNADERVETLESLDDSKRIPNVLKKMLPTDRAIREVRGAKQSNNPAAQQIVQSQRYRRVMGMFINTTHKVEYEVYWCGVEGLFEVEGYSSTRYMMILGDMCRAPPNVFQTIVGQAMVRHHWGLVFEWGFCVDRAIDVSALIFFASMAAAVHQQNLPVYHQIYGSLCCSLISMFTNLCAHIQCFNLYKTLWPVMTFWSIVFALLDMSNVIVLAVLAQQSYNFDNFDSLSQLSEGHVRKREFVGSFFDLHPVVFSMLVAGKWFKFMLALLNLELIGTAILPVWEAARSRESLVFLSYLILGTVACAHSYYTYAIDDIPDFFMSFFRMVRLTFLGDFDMMEIMGVDQHMALANVSALYGAASLNDTAYTDAIVGGIDDDDQPIFKYGIRAWVIMWAFMGPVMFMNIYIGLLGKAYEEATANIEALFAQFRVNTLMMCLLRRHFWQQPVSNVCKCFGLSRSDARARGHLDQNPNGEFKGYWIVVPAKLTQVEDDLDDVSNKLDKLSKQMMDENAKVDTFSKQMRDENAALREDSAALRKDSAALRDELKQMRAMLEKALE